MYKNNIEEELNSIRIELYAATNGMTISERLEYYHNQVKPVYQEFGIKPIDRVPERNIKLKSDNLE
jgi:hypothetical protein